MTSGRSSDWGSFALGAFPDFSSGVLHRPSPFTALGTFRNFTGFPILPHWRAPDGGINARANYKGKPEPAYKIVALWLSSTAIGGHALIRKPEPLGLFSMLPEHVNQEVIPPLA